MSKASRRFAMRCSAIIAWIGICMNMVLYCLDSTYADSSFALMILEETVNAGSSPGIIAWAVSILVFTLTAVAAVKPSQWRPATASVLLVGLASVCLIVVLYVFNLKAAHGISPVELLGPFVLAVLFQIGPGIAMLCFGDRRGEGNRADECPNCGQILAGSIRCPECGYPISGRIR